MRFLYSRLNYHLFSNMNEYINLNIKFDKCNLISTLIKEAEHNGLKTTKYIFKRNTVLFLPICVKGLSIFLNMNYLLLA